MPIVVLVGRDGKVLEKDDIPYDEIITKKAIVLDDYRVFVHDCNIEDKSIWREIRTFRLKGEELFPHYAGTQVS